jgi:protein SCO1/2
MKRTVIVLAAISVIALAAGLLAGRFLAPAPDSRLPPGGDFTLESADGPVSLAGLRGKVVLVYFGYASCPDVCPTSLALIAQALRALAPAERARVRVLFVSLDPGRDTPAKLKQYVGFFHPDIAGVTGAPAVLDEVAARYGASYRMQPVASAVKYVVDHSSITSVVASDGRLVEQLPHGTEPAEIAKAVRRWL